jgi:hypothetical protein
MDHSKAYERLKEAVQPIVEDIENSRAVWEPWEEGRSKLGFYLTKPQIQNILSALEE